MLAVVVVVALDREVAGLEGERNRVGALGAVVREVGAGGIDRNSQLLHTHSAAVLVDFEDRARIDVITSMSHVSPTARWPLSPLWKTLLLRSTTRPRYVWATLVLAPSLARHRSGRSYSCAYNI